MVADALHNMGDVGALFSAWIALRISQRKPGKIFRYGYFKAENLATLFIAIFISYEAIELLIEGYAVLFVLPDIQEPLPPLILASISILIHFVMMRHLFKVGNAIGSQSLIVNAQERRVCIFTSSIVFLNVILGMFKVPYVEGVVTLLISLLVLRVGFYAARDSIYVLMDASPGEDIEKKIQEFIISNPDISHFRDLRLRRSGSIIFGEVTIQLKEAHVKQAHEVAHFLESQIVDAMEHMDSFTIHVEPFESREKVLVFPITEDRGLDSIVAERFARSDHFMFVTLDKSEGKIKKVHVEENIFKEKNMGAGLAAANALIEKGATTLISNEIGQIAFHILGDHNIELYCAEDIVIKDILEKFMKKKLVSLADHTTMRVCAPPEKRTSH
jgi:cation diffusion facilitator family transporter